MRLLAASVLVFLTLPQVSIATDFSEASEVSVASSMALGEGAIDLVASGSKLIVTAASAGAEAGSLIISAAGTGASFTVQVSMEAATAALDAIGSGVERVAVSGGWLLMLSGEALRFVPDENARQHLHQRELYR